MCAIVLALKIHKEEMKIIGGTDYAEFCLEIQLWKLNMQPL